MLPPIRIWLPLIVLLAGLLWPAAVSMSNRAPSVTGKRILILIAHPDDEVMFFGPIIHSLGRPELDNQLSLLCLSTGNADGIGEIRKKEVQQSARMIGIQDVTVIHDESRFADSAAAEWSPADVADELETRTKTADFDVIVTFDDHGVSGHPNHIAVSAGAVRYAAAIKNQLFSQSQVRGQRPDDNQREIAVYGLASHSLVRKYSSLFDVFVSAVQIVVRTKREAKGREGQGQSRPAAPPKITAISSTGQASLTRSAMVHAHVSQMRWFRWGWIWLSRYMYVNDLSLLI